MSNADTPAENTGGNPATPATASENGPLADLRPSWNWADVKTGLRLGVVGLVFTTVGAFVWT
ncbi:hypothetical protein QDK53_15105, partial [Amycolatopsis magusensis]|nr:hypothetical protein [Amycolatopsis magusensis]